MHDLSDNEPATTQYAFQVADNYTSTQETEPAQEDLEMRAHRALWISVALQAIRDYVGIVRNKKLQMDYRFAIAQRDRGEAITGAEAALMRVMESTVAFFECETHHCGSLNWILENFTDDTDNRRAKILEYIHLPKPPLAFHDSQKREFAALFGLLHPLRRRKI